MKSLFLNTVPSLFDDFDRYFAQNRQFDYFLDEDQRGYYLSIDLPGIKKKILE